MPIHDCGAVDIHTLIASSQQQHKHKHKHKHKHNTQHTQPNNQTNKSTPINQHQPTSNNQHITAAWHSKERLGHGRFRSKQPCVCRCVLSSSLRETCALSSRVMKNGVVFLVLLYVNTASSATDVLFVPLWWCKVLGRDSRRYDLGIIQIPMVIVGTQESSGRGSEVCRCTHG